VEVTAERLNEAFTTFDTDADGKISFDEFTKWWRRDDVSYNLKRSEAIEPALPTSMNTATTSTEQSRARMSQSQVVNKRSKTPTRISREHNSKSQSGLGLTSSRRSAVGVGSGVGGDDQPNTCIAMPTVCYHGNDTKNIEIAGLNPNSLYHFKLRYVGSRSNSALSSPLVLMTTPLACEAPILIYLTPTCVRIKWYPALYGAYKYCVQIHDQTQRDSDYTSIFIGQENYWMSTTLTPDMVYTVRVIGVNAQGHLGIPSAPLTFRTYPRDETKHLITSRNINEFFSIECTSDICVGDTILLTERMYHKSKSVVPPPPGLAQTSGGGTRSGGGGGGGGGLNKSGGVQAGTSVYSVSSTGYGGYLITGDAPSSGNYIGERTIAAHVIKDNFKTTRVALQTKELTPSLFNKTRRLWLEVIWQRASNENCKPFELKAGEVIERMSGHIEQFEVFRRVWIHETLRKPFKDDIQSLTDCFLQHPL
jgi:hypothetical protein